MGKLRRTRTPTRNLTREERLWTSELRKRHKRYGAAMNTDREDKVLSPAPPPAARREDAPLLHQRPLKMKKKPPQPKKPRRRYTTRAFGKKEGWEMYVARAKELGIDPKSFDDKVVMDVVDAINEEFKLPPRFPPEERARYTEYDPLRMEPDMYNSHRRYAYAGPQIMFAESLCGPYAGVFMPRNRPTRSLPLPLRPPYLTLLTAKSTAVYRGRFDAFRRDIIDYIEFSMDPLAFVTRVIEEEMQEMCEDMPAVIPECFLEEFLDTPGRLLQIQEAEVEVFRLAALYDFVMRLCEQEEDGRWDRAYPQIRSHRYYDPLPFAPGSRETRFPWFGKVPLAVYDEAIRLSGDIEPPGVPKPRNCTTRPLAEEVFTPKVPNAMLRDFDDIPLPSEKSVKKLETLARDEFHMPLRPCGLLDVPPPSERPTGPLQYHPYTRHRTRFPQQSNHGIVRRHKVPSRVIERPPPVVPRRPFLHRPYPPTAAGVEDPIEYERLVKRGLLLGSDSDDDAHEVWDEAERPEWLETQSYTYTSSTSDDDESSEGMTQQECAFWGLDPIHHVKGYARAYYNAQQAELEKHNRVDPRLLTRLTIS